MTRIYREIVIRSLHPPAEKDLESDLEWFCESLGIISARDKEQTGMRLFRLLLRYAKRGEPVTINTLAEQMNLSRTSVVHHLNNLEESGFIVRKNREIELRMHNLRNLVDEIEQDFERSLARIKKIAREIDREMGLPVRE